LDNPRWTSGDEGRTTTLELTVDIGERTPVVQGVVLLRDPATKDYASGVGNSKSRKRPGSATSRQLRMLALPWGGGRALSHPSFAGVNSDDVHTIELVADNPSGPS
jgi:hypothetical protein